MPAATAQDSKLVSVILVNWNRLADVRLALSYLTKLHYPNVEVIVVDNGSTDGSVEALRQMPEVRLIELGRNAGPCLARNAAIREARGEYVFFLDSDAVLSKRALEPLVAAMERDPRLGVIGCRIDLAKSRRVDQWIYAQPHERRAHQAFETYAFSAAGALARRRALEEVGGFDERLFIYNEEVELSYKIIPAGYKIAYDSAARVYHRPSDAGRAPGKDYWRLMARNWIWIFFEFYPAAAAWRRALLYAAVYVVKGLARGQLPAVARGLSEGFGRRGEFAVAPKLSQEQIARIDRLNPRRRIKLSR
jgi:N-acetylglucosaminyl-diphospho-decaprenol L-rhamnosyltransferase